MDIRRLGPEALETYLIHSLFLRAFPEDSLVTPGGYAAHPERYRAMLASPNFTFFVGADDSADLGLSLIYLPGPGDCGFAQLVHFHNEGTPRLRAALVDLSVAWVKAHGHDRGLCVNATGRPPSIWARMFQRAGTVSKVGDIMMIDFSAPLSEAASPLPEENGSATGLQEEGPSPISGGGEDGSRREAE